MLVVFSNKFGMDFAYILLKIVLEVFETNFLSLPGPLTPREPTPDPVGKP